MRSWGCLVAHYAKVVSDFCSWSEEAPEFLLLSLQALKSLKVLLLWLMLIVGVWVGLNLLMKAMN